MGNSLVKAKWASLEIDQEGYSHVLNIETDVALGPDEPGYDERAIDALYEEVIPLMGHYDYANVVNPRPSQKNS